MNIKQTKKPEPRVEPKYISTLGMQAYDIDNLYPQNIQRIVAASATASTCFGRYVDFIEGNGLSNQALSDFIINMSGETVDDMHHLCSEDVGRYWGIAIHVNYNLLGKIVGATHIPFENCRLEEPDARGCVSRIFVHPDWTGRMTRQGKKVTITVENVDIFPVFNPDPEIVRSQIAAAGGIEYYKGQVLWVSMSGKWTYPIPRYDSVITDMSTDEGLSNIMYRNARNNFLISGVFVVRRGTGGPVDETGEDYVDNIGYAEELARVQGDMKANVILQAEIGPDEDMPEFIPFQTQNFDKDFTATNESIAERIYSVFGQEAFYCLRTGKVGFSGNLINDAKIEYSQRVQKEQRTLTRSYKKIFDNWDESAGLPFTVGEPINIEPIITQIADAAL